MTTWRYLAGVVAAAALFTGCGGSGDDVPESEGADVPPASETGDDEPPSEVDGDVAADPTDPPAEDDSPAEADPLTGPTLEPTLAFEVPRSETPSLDQMALSPAGDRVTVWSLDSSLARILTVFDTSTGAELASAETEAKGDLFWSTDDRIIIIGNSEVLSLDPATLAGASPPISYDSFACSGSNGHTFDRERGLFFGEFNLDSICRLDLATGEIATYTNDDGVNGSAVEIGGDKVYAYNADDDRNITRLTLDATTMELVAEAEASGPQPVLAATAAGIIQRQSEGFDYEILPAGVAVPRFQVVQPSYSGAHYVACHDGGSLLIDSVSGTVVGRIEDIARYDWSSDDSVLAMLSTEGEMEIYRLG